MAIELVEAFLQDEVPALGSGRRRLLVSVGRKWVVICNPYTGRSRILRRPAWEGIHYVVLETDPKEILARIPAPKGRVPALVSELMSAIEGQLEVEGN